MVLLPKAQSTGFEGMASGSTFKTREYHEKCSSNNSRLRRHSLVLRFLFSYLRSSEYWKSKSIISNFKG